MTARTATERQRARRAKSAQEGERPVYAVLTARANANLERWIILGWTIREAISFALETTPPAGRLPGNPPR